MAFWSVVQTETSREDIARFFLKARQFETYLPKIKTQRRIGPLFPGYLFVRIERSWWQIDNTVGVIQVLKSGDQPARLKDEIISTIKAQEKGGLVKLPEPKRLKPGDKIRIKQGSFANHLAIYQGMSGKDRSRVLLEFLGRKVMVEIPQADVQQLA
jgi:transcriptional antiterminator RfaH